ncbi:MAG: hypothetical protein PHW52_03865 [Candidatus Pacebacteria bacterium]|nr:hypothetical protein [Candidatus Paceibacterota bacterium]
MKKAILTFLIIVIGVLVLSFYYSGNQRGWSSKEVLPTDCSSSKNSEIKKEFRIGLADIKDKDAYAIKRKEFTGIVNECYDVKLIEEYEVLPGEVSAQEGGFKNKINKNTRVFDKIPLYPQLELLDYEGIGLDNGMIYAHKGKYEEIMNYYKGISVQGYKQELNPSGDEIIWTNMDNSQKLIVIKFQRINDQETQIRFDYIEPLAAD